MEPVLGGGEWMVAFPGNDMCQGVGFFPLFPVPLLIPVFPILVTPQYFLYPFMPLISQNFLIVSTSLVLYFGQLVHHPYNSDVPELSSDLSFEQMVGFSLVHSSLGFLGCESWKRLN